MYYKGTTQTNQESVEDTQVRQLPIISNNVHTVSMNTNALLVKGGNTANIWEVQLHYSLSPEFNWGFFLQSLPGDRFRYCLDKSECKTHKACGRIRQTVIELL